jgi:hypothetical protein
MTKYFTLFAAIILLFGACNTGSYPAFVDADNALVVSIKRDDILKNVKLSDFITDVRIVPLETTSESLIGQLDQIDFSNGDIVVLDYRKARAVYRFSKDGKFLNQIAQRGQGPGEHSALGDISVNPNNPNEIAILDQGRKILIYKPDNTFLREIRVPPYAYRMGWFDNKIAVYGGNKEEDVALIDENTGKEIAAFFKTDWAKKLVLPHPFQLYENRNMLYLSTWDHTIYRIFKDRAFPHVRLVSDRPMFTDNDIGLIRENMDNRHNFVSIAYYNENSSHISMVCIYERRAHLLIYDKLNSKTAILDLGNVQNDVTFAQRVLVPIAVDPNGYFVAQFEYSDVFNLDAFRRRFGRAAENLDLMSNPILVFFKFKSL